MCIIYLCLLDICHIIYPIFPPTKTLFHIKQTNNSRQIIAYNLCIPMCMYMHQTDGHLHNKHSPEHVA